MRISVSDSYIQSQWGRVNRYLPALGWLAGLLLGFCVTKYIDNDTVSLVYSLPFGGIDIVRFLTVCLLPAMISVLAERLGERWILIPLSIICGFGFGFVSMLIGFAYGRAGWLVRFLLMFSRCMILPVLMLYWIAGARKRSLSWLLILYAAIIGLLDFFIMMPFVKAVLF